MIIYDSFIGFHEPSFIREKYEIINDERHAPFTIRSKNIGIIKKASCKESMIKNCESTSFYCCQFINNRRNEYL